MTEISYDEKWNRYSDINANFPYAVEKENLIYLDDNIEL